MSDGELPIIEADRQKISGKLDADEFDAAAFFDDVDADAAAASVDPEYLADLCEIIADDHDAARVEVLTADGEPMILLPDDDSGVGYAVVSDVRAEEDSALYSEPELAEEDAVDVEVS